MRAIEDTRNIIDAYKGWEHEEIMKDLESKKHNFSVLAVNLELDINTCGILRVAEAMGTKKVFFYGNKHVNARPFVGANHYCDIGYIPDNGDFPWEDYYVVGFDNVPQSEGLQKFDWPFDKPVLMCFGQEKGGIPQQIIEKCQNVIMIEQYGAVRCLNVLSAASMAIYDYVAKFHNLQK